MIELSTELKKPFEYYQKWRYKNTALLVISFLVLLYFADSQFVRGFIVRIGELGYIGAFITGILFTSLFTAVPALVLLYHLADLYNPLFIALLAGIGAVVGDYIIFRFLKDRVFGELQLLFNKMGGSYIAKMFRTPYFIWLLPFVGAFIVASPLPDEAGITLLSLSKLKNWQFIAIAFLLNAIGIFLVVTLARSF